MLTSKRKLLLSTLLKRCGNNGFAFIPAQSGGGSIRSQATVAATAQRSSVRNQNGRDDEEPWERDIYTLDPVNKDEKTYDKILIANRGEIACRIIKTARKMGIKTVAVHSVADANAKFVHMADERVNIGPAPAIQSYLVMEKILKSVEMTGAQAVHPGYGFLSENTQFVAELERRKVDFIGPNSKAIQGMGDKLASKKLAEDANVNLIPGFDGVIENENHCVDLSRKIGYPVMIKASAGGGGKGMRIANNDSEAREAFRLCSEEGKSSFNDDRLLVEKFITSPKHIEIQILGDKHQNCVYLFERECSIQRRNQKVIEEAPSPFLDEETRRRMGEQAVQLSQAIGYDSAGTVEFLVDADKNFYFLEMNTRLQVEHPITECITGVDLVHQMIRSAANLKLNIKQSDLKIKGWAIESRVYAEDATKNFGMPSTGRLYKYKQPSIKPSSERSGIRCDSGITEGSEISMYYDSMISKLTSYGADREEAISRNVEALDKYVIGGVKHNIPLLRDVLTRDDFKSGLFTTNYLPETYPEGFQGVCLTDEEKFRVASMASVLYVKREMHRRKKESLNNCSFSLAVHDREGDKGVMYVHVGKKADSYVVSFMDDADSDRIIADKSYKQCVIEDNFKLSDDVIEAFIKSSEGGLSDVGKGRVDKDVFQLLKSEADGTQTMRFRGSSISLSVLPAVSGKLLKHMKEKVKVDASKLITSPMPGVVKSVSVEIGEMVGEGQECCVVEAMKMQNSMKSGISGKVKNVNVKVGDLVQDDQILIEFE